MGGGLSSSSFFFKFAVQRPLVFKASVGSYHLKSACTFISNSYYHCISGRSFALFTSSVQTTRRTSVLTTYELCCFYHDDIFYPGGHMKIKVADQEGEFKKLDSTPPDGTAKPASVMTMEAVVDATPQQLRPIKSFFAMTKAVPQTIPVEAQIVLQAIFSCFDRQKTVQEGLVGDMIWGFEQAGIHANCVIVGLIQLEKLQFVKFQAPDNTYIDLQSQHAPRAWVRYQKKLLEMVYEDPAPV